MSSSKTTVAVTGATGLLGRAVVKALSSNYNVVGTSFSRAREGLVKLDITRRAEIAGFFATHKPVAVIQCAAERRPDVAEKDPDAATAINVSSAAWVAEESHRSGAWFCYLSTDYVFDGKNPPYEVDAQPCPLNYYGQSKWEGEKACLAANPNSVILRVPLLYGHVEYFEESAVNCLVPIIKAVLMDDFQVRYPTNTADAAQALFHLVSKHLSGQAIKGIYHFCGKEQISKYEMCVIIAKAMGGLDISHLTPLREVPADATTTRPYNAHLSNKRIEEEAGIRVDCVPFANWWELNAPKA
ncbi:dTDP-4-dehydrorhamnose reductase [Chytriomyces sp. MP71]|nr:dTDP-4-dehydrorhamnose reductase [Chytriomyces sp. MP71]